MVSEFDAVVRCVAKRLNCVFRISIRDGGSFAVGNAITNRASREFSATAKSAVRNLRHGLLRSRRVAANIAARLVARKPLEEVAGERGASILVSFVAKLLKTNGPLPRCSGIKERFAVGIALTERGSIESSESANTAETPLKLHEHRLRVGQVAIAVRNVRIKAASAR